MPNQLQTKTGTVSRLYFIDHLRVSLVILVVIHHAAMVYGAAAPFYYVEPPAFNELRTFQALLVFVLVNQSFFMGALFLLAGYFAPASFDRKGAGSFLKEKLLRLGIPLVAFFFVLNPVASIAYHLMPTAITGITAPLTWQDYPDLIGMGPLWFVAVLLIFNFAYVGWRWVTKNRAVKTQKTLAGVTYLGIITFTVALAVASYLIRLVVPLGKSVLDFPTLAYLPQYLGLFVAGAVANRRDWFRTLSNAKGIVGITAAVTAGVFLFPLAFSGRLFSLALGPALGNSMGNGHWQSAIYAIWDSVFAVGMTLGLIVLFRRLLNGSGKLGRFLSAQSYGVYIVHIPLVVYLAYAMRGIDVANLMKFALLTVIAIPVCFGVAYLLRRIPGVSRIV